MWWSSPDRRMNLHNNFPVRAAVVLVVATFTAAAPAPAADWQFNPTVEVGAMSDNNLRLDHGGERVDVAGAFGSGRFELRATTPLAQFSITPRVEATHFPADADRDEDYVDGGVGMLWLRRWRTGLSRFQADFDDSSTVTGNRPDASPEDGELGEPDAPGDSGSLTASNRMQTLNLRQTLRFDVSQRDALELSAGFFDRDFDEQVINEDVSFTALTGRIGWSRQLHERSSLGLRGRVLRFDPELIPLVSTNLGLEGEWRYQVSERVESYVRAGASRASFKASAGPDPDSRTAFVGGAGASWQLQVSRIFLDLTRTVDPNSAGVTVQRNQARVRLDRDFSERARGSLAMRFIADEGPAGFNERRYAVVSIGSEWRFTRTWSLAGRFDHRWQDYEFTPGSASSNALRLSVIYQPRREAANSGSLLD